jgi:hypothetical protein
MAVPVPLGGGSSCGDGMLWIMREDVWIHSAMIMGLKVIADDLNSRPNCAVSSGLLLPAAGQ